MKYFPFLIILFEIFLLVHSVKIIKDLEPISGTIENVKKSNYKSFATYRFDLYNQNNVYVVSGNTSWFKELPRPNRIFFFFRCTNSIFIDKNYAIATSSNNTISKIKLWYNVYAIINNSLWIVFITIGFWVVLFKVDENKKINPWFSIVYAILKLLIFVLM